MQDGLNYTVKDKHMTLKGIDVSHHQGKIDWAKVKESGIDFAIIRVGYSNRNGNGGLNFDKRYIYNLQECNRLGIPVGVYIYCYDRSASAAAITAKAFVKTIKKYKIEYPVIYDIEYDNKDLPKSINTAICKAAMKVIEDAGYYGMIYASKDFFQNHLHMSELEGTDKWEAAYRLHDDLTVNNSMWQYSSNGSVPGIVGKVDMDYSYKDYPSIIRKAGLNGFVAEKELAKPNTIKPEPIVATPKPEKTEPVKTVAPTTVTKIVTANKLNVRKGPGMEYAALRVITKGTKVEVSIESNGWSKIGASEWVSSKFIK